MPWVHNNISSRIVDRKLIDKLTAFASFWMVLVLSFSGCDAWTTAQGTIRDTSGKPIPDAVVTVKTRSDSREFHSLKDGQYLVQMWQPPFKQDVTLTVSKPGYDSFERRLKGPGTYKDFDVVLEPIPQEPPDSKNIIKAMFPNAPDKPRHVECFRSLTPEMSVNAVVQKCGRPDGEFGSGIYIIVWEMPDGSSVSIGTPYLNRIGDVRLSDASGKTTYLPHKK